MAVERTDPTSGLEDNMGSNCDRTQVLKTCVWDRLEAPRLSSDDNKKLGALGWMLKIMNHTIKSKGTCP